MMQSQNLYEKYRPKDIIELRPACSKNWTVYVLDTWRPWSPYVGITQQHVLNRVNQHATGRGAWHTQMYGVRSLVCYRSGISENQAKDYEIYIRDELAFVFELERCRCSNGIEVWAENGKLQSRLD